MIIFNWGKALDRMDLIVGNASTPDTPPGGPSNLAIPVVGPSFAVGEAWPRRARRRSSRC